MWHKPFNMWINAELLSDRSEHKIVTICFQYYWESWVDNDLTFDLCSENSTKTITITTPSQILGNVFAFKLQKKCQLPRKSFY